MNLVVLGKINGGKNSRFGEIVIKSALELGIRCNPWHCRSLSWLGIAFVFSKPKSSGNCMKGQGSGLK